MHQCSCIAVLPTMDPLDTRLCAHTPHLTLIAHVPILDARRQDAARQVTNYVETLLQSYLLFEHMSAPLESGGTVSPWLHATPLTSLGTMYPHMMAS